MFNLQIEDFGSPEKINSQEITKEDIEKYYQNQISQIKEQYEQKLKEEYQKGFEEGYNQAKKDLIPQIESQFTQKLEEKITKQKKELLAQLDNQKKQLTQLTEELKQKYKKHIQFIEELILSALEEMLEYLYIKPENAQYVAEEIKKIIEDIRSPEIILEISPDLKEYIENTGVNLKIIENNKLQGGDFNIKIENTQFENRFKEKMEILKDEIKKEIKKNSPLQD